MMDISIISEVLGSAGFGAITGGLFGWLSRREERENLKVQNQHELNMLAKTSQHQAELADKKREQSEAQAFVESQKPMSIFSDSVKSLVRPAITAALLLITYEIYQALQEITGGVNSLSPDQQFLLYKMLIQNIITLTATAVSWWFASRPSNNTQIRWKI